MARLFIIGNGYDMARRGDTSYLNFRKWLTNLKSEYKINENELSNYKNILSYPTEFIKNNFIIPTEEIEQNEIFLNNASIKRKILAINILFDEIPFSTENEWKNFEGDLANIDLKNVIKKYRQNNNQLLYYSPVDKVTDVITSLHSEIQSLFAEWVSTFFNKLVGKKGFEKKIIKEINKDDIFLIFNYSETVEDIFNNYSTETFYHIHGVYKDKSSIIFGHNCKSKSKATNLNDENDYIDEFYACLFKNPQKIIEKNTKLWERISKFDSIDIYEFGWSCSDVDKDYIDKIVDLLKNKINHLYINNYKNNGMVKKQQWVDCGLPSNLIYFYEENDDDIKPVDENVILNGCVS